MIKCWSRSKLGSQLSWVTLSLKNLVKVMHLHSRKLLGRLNFNPAPGEVQALIKYPLWIRSLNLTQEESTLQRNEDHIADREGSTVFPHSKSQIYVCI